MKNLIFITSIVVFIIFSDSCKDCHDRGDCPQPVDTTIIKGEWIKAVMLPPEFDNNVIMDVHHDTVADILYFHSNKTLYSWDGTNWKSFENEFNFTCTRNLDFKRYNNKVYMLARNVFINGEYNDGIIVLENNEFKEIILADTLIYSICTYDNKLAVYGKFDTIAGISTYGFAEFNGNDWQALENPQITSTYGTHHLKNFNNDLYLVHHEGTLYKRNGGSWDKIYEYENSAPFWYDIQVINNELYVAGYFIDQGQHGQIHKWNGSEFNSLSEINDFDFSAITGMLFDKDKFYCTISSFRDTIKVPVLNRNYWQIMKSYSENCDDVVKVCKFKGELYAILKRGNYIYKWQSE